MSKTHSRSRPPVCPAGFTLIEVMVVIVILGLLFGIVGTNVFQQDAQARTDTARMNVARIHDAVEQYLIERRRMPTWDDLIRRHEDGRQYLKNLSGPKKDPWGRSYVITTDPDATREPMVYSFGPDGIDDRGTGDDICSKTLGDG